MPRTRKAKPAEPDKGGRPDLLTPERAERIEQAIRMGATREDAAGYVGISTATLYSWLRAGREYRDEHPDGYPDGDEPLTARVKLLEATQKAESGLATVMVGRIVSAANSGTWQAAAWWLERRRHEAFGRKDFMRAEVTGKDGGPVEHEVIDHREALAERLARLIPDQAATDALALASGVTPDESHAATEHT